MFPEIQTPDFGLIYINCFLRKTRSSFTWNGLIGRASPPQHGPIDPPVTTECSERAAWTSPVYCVVFPAKQHGFKHGPKKHHPHCHMYHHMEHKTQSTPVRGVLIDLCVVCTPVSQMIFTAFQSTNINPLQGIKLSEQYCNTTFVTEKRALWGFVQEINYISWAWN